MDVFKNLIMKHGYLCLLALMSLLLCGCPYISNRKINVGVRKPDDRLVGYWRYAGGIRKDTSYGIIPHHLSVTRSGKNTYLAMRVADTVEPVLLDFYFATPHLYQKTNYLSVEMRSAYQPKMRDDQRIFLYYYYGFAGDTLMLSEVNEKLYSLIDSSKASDFRQVLKYKDDPGFTGEVYYYLRER